MKKVIGFVSIFMLVLLGACGSSEEKIVVLTSSGYAPYEMVDTSGKLTGFDIELMEAIAEELGFVIEWKDVDFDGIVASLQSGKADIAIAGLTPTEERKEMVDFSEYYYQLTDELTNVFLFDANNFELNSLEGLAGLTVGAQIGTVQESYLESVKDTYGFDIDLRSTNTMIVEEIKAGRIDVLMVEQEIATSILELNTSLSTVGIATSLDLETGNAIAFAKGSIYLEDVNKALEILKENGELDRLIAKWFQ